jgi:hypothetical protein
MDTRAAGAATGFDDGTQALAEITLAKAVLR